MSISELLDFYKTGGTLKPGDPSYIRRPADDELYAHLIAGRYCYVLTSRQRGKSSLMAQTAERLKHAGVAVSIIDLSAIGTGISQEAWYFGIIMRLADDLHLAVDTRNWWRTRSTISPIQRLNQFLNDLVLQKIAGPLVIFFDEIDTTLAIDFSDDFFAAIRQLYNLRAANPIYERLTIALLGVATPTDLIKDPNRTPFNIGRSIALGEFRRVDAAPLEGPLDKHFPGQGHALLDRVFFWTGGHPYLTQRLCQALIELPPARYSDSDVDRIVQRLFLGEEGRVENNLRYVRSSVEALSPGRRRAVLLLYQRVLAGNAVAEEQRAPDQERLRLIGLIRAEDGYLRVRNEIYRHVFDITWARSLTPRDWARIATIIAAAVIVAVVIAGGIGYYLQRKESNRIAQIGALSQRCGLPNERQRVIDEFVQLDPDGRAQLLHPSNDDQVWKAQLALARCVKPALLRITDPIQHQALVEQLCCVVHDDDPYEAQEINDGRPCSCGAR